MTINYCLACGQPLKALDETTYRCPQGHGFWNTPRTGTSVIFIKDSHVLLSERAREPRKGLYSFPGGFLKFGEAPRAAAIREVKEETGVDVTELELLDARTVMYEENETTCSILFLAKAWKGEFVAADDSAALVWQTIDSLELDKFAWPTTDMVAKLKTLAVRVESEQLVRN